MDIKLYIKDPSDARGSTVNLIPEGGRYISVSVNGAEYPMAVRIAPQPPKDRMLADILRNAVQHGVDYPGHGTNCACMDRFIREIGNQVRSAIPPSPEEGFNDFKARAARNDALSRVRWVLMSVVRGL